MPVGLCGAFTTMMERLSVGLANVDVLLGLAPVAVIRLIDRVTQQLVGQTLGQVTRLMDNGAQSLLCVGRLVSANTPDSGATDRTERPKELLIPFVDVFVDGVDLAARRISVDWGEDY